MNTNPTCRGPHPFAGLWLMGLGALFLLRNLGYIDHVGQFWPVAMIVFGVSILVRRSSVRG